MLYQIYCIPGLGTDEKIFANLKIENAELHFLNWLDPKHGEPFHNYAQRMAKGIEANAALIIAVSFGGMVALEIAKIKKVTQVILVSSIKTKKELPLKWKLAGKLKLYKIFPAKSMHKLGPLYPLANKRLGAFTKKEMDMANHYRRVIRPDYLRWSLHQILNWQNERVPENIVHIHGSRDRVIPLKTSRPTHIIGGGTHMMILNRADEISAIINRVLKHRF